MTFNNGHCIQQWTLPSTICKYVNILSSIYVFQACFLGCSNLQMSIKGVAVVVLLVTDVVHPCKIEQQLLLMTW